MTTHTLDDLRKAGEAVPTAPPDNCPLGMHMIMFQAECTKYHCARAAFWQMYAEFLDQIHQRRSITIADVEWDLADLAQARAIAEQVRART